jgi:hypothetical protein
MNAISTWPERCKALFADITEACTLTAVAAGPAALTRELARRIPDAPFREVLSRGGWYRLGRVLDAQGAEVAANLEDWATEELDERGGDMSLLLDDYAGQKLTATRYNGRTHYLVAGVGSGPADFLQLEVEDLQETEFHPLFDQSPTPTSLEELVDPRLPADNLLRPLGLPRYKFRRLTHVGDTLARMRLQSLEPQPIHRFVEDWEQSSARTATNLSNHWVFAISEHLDRFKQPVSRARPVSAINGEPQRLSLREGTKGLALHEALAGFDRQIGYPFAWYFHMLTSKSVPHWTARTVAEDAAAGYAYLPEKDIKVVKSWLHRSYAF